MLFDRVNLLDYLFGALYLLSNFVHNKAAYEIWELIFHAAVHCLCARNCCAA